MKKINETELNEIATYCERRYGVCEATNDIIAEEIEKKMGNKNTEIVHKEIFATYNCAARDVRGIFKEKVTHMTDDEIFEELQDLDDELFEYCIEVGEDFIANNFRIKEKK